MKLANVESPNLHKLVPFLTILFFFFFERSFSRYSSKFCWMRQVWSCRWTVMDRSSRQKCRPIWFLNITEHQYVHLGLVKSAMITYMHQTEDCCIILLLTHHTVPYLIAIKWWQKLREKFFNHNNHTSSRYQKWSTQVQGNQHNHTQFHPIIITNKIGQCDNIPMMSFDGSQPAPLAAAYSQHTKPTFCRQGYINWALQKGNNSVTVV